MLRIEVSTLVSRPVPEVWGYFIDLTNSARWTRSGSELRQTSDGALGVGATINSVRPMFGWEIKSQTMTVTHYEPEHLASFTAAIPVLGRVTGGFTFKSEGGGTRLSRWSDLGLGRAEGLLGSILDRVARRGQQTEMANLKRLIEARL